MIIQNKTQKLIYNREHLLKNAQIQIKLCLHSNIFAPVFRKILFGERFADAFRNTVCVILPLLMGYAGPYRSWSIGMAVGVLLISLTDLPGTRKHKLRDALRNTLLFFGLTLIFLLTAYTGIVLVILTFILAMLAAFGGRSGVSGTMAIVLLVFLLGLHPAAPLQFALAILLGCVWFQLVNLLQIALRPYRSLQQALADAQATTADFLRAKADCYELSVPLNIAYQRTIALHIRIWEKQELVRQLLPAQGQAPELAMEAVRVMASYEQITAMHYDYAEVREKLATSGALPIMAELIRALADNRPTDALVDELTKYNDEVIQSVLINIQAIKHVNVAKPIEVDAFRPVRQPLRSYITLHSPVLRFALRLSILFAIAYAGIYFLAKDPYGYWLLLTIVIVARPRLAITWQRNLERIAGTITGLCIAGILIWVVPSPIILLVVAALALFAFFAWNRPKYSFSVAGITICVVICLSLYHGSPQLIVTARLLYSLAGCALAFLGLLIFPVWVRAEIKDLAHLAVTANRDLLRAVMEQQDIIQIKLARKAAHLRLAKLSEGLAHARVEPGHADLNRLEQLQVLNYRINAVILSLYLSGRPVTATTALAQLNFFLDGKSQRLVEPDPGFSKGIRLLERLCAELDSIA